MFVLLHIIPLSIDLEFINPVRHTEETDEVVQRNQSETVHVNACSSNLIFASKLKLTENIGEGEQ